jgi:hypothetical protein
MKEIKILSCCCCSQKTEGRQWWNRDRGYGLCEKCAEIIEDEEDEKTMKELYGIKGIHYQVK